MPSNMISSILARITSYNVCYTKLLRSKFIHTYTGAVLYSPEDKYQKISFSDMEKSPLDRKVTDGWAAMIQHYFVAALIPDRGKEERYYTKTLTGPRYRITSYNVCYTKLLRSTASS